LRGTSLVLHEGRTRALRRRACALAVGRVLKKIEPARDRANVRQSLQSDDFLGHDHAHNRRTVDGTATGGYWQGALAA
jgi:hypothetical protein